MDSQPDNLSPQSDPESWPPAPSAESGTPQAKSKVVPERMGIARYFGRSWPWEHIGVFVGLLGIILFQQHAFYFQYMGRYYCSSTGAPYPYWRECMWGMTFMQLGEVLCLLQIVVGGLARRGWSLLTGFIGALILGQYLRNYAGCNQESAVIKLFTRALHGFAPCDFR